MENNNFRVIILKAPPEDSSKQDVYIETLRDFGISSTMIPTLQFRFKNLENLAQRLANPQHYSGIIVNSPRCANSIIESFELLKNDNYKLQWKKLRCFVVGEATAHIIRNNLAFSCEGSTCGNLSNLLEFISKYSFDKPFLMPCGNLHKERESSTAIEKIETYETHEHADLQFAIENILKAEEVLSLITFFSPSGVKSALPYLKKISNKNLKFIAIGPTTAQELKNNKLEVSGICEKPNPENLMQTVLAIMKKEVALF